MKTFQAFSLGTLIFSAAESGGRLDLGSYRANPGAVVRLVPGDNPSETALAEIYNVPKPGFGIRGADIDGKGGRIDDPKAGWKGRGLWTPSRDRSPWLMEEGKAANRSRCTSSPAGFPGEIERCPGRETLPPPALTSRRRRANIPGR
jgi:hypothetical protein